MKRNVPSEFINSLNLCLHNITLFLSFLVIIHEGNGKVDDGEDHHNARDDLFL